MNANSEVVLTEDMQMFDYWSQVYSPADRHIDSLRAAYDAFLQHYTLPRTEQMEVEDFDLKLSTHEVSMRVFNPAQPAPSQGWKWIFYVHGGGNVVGGADSHEYIARQLSRDLNLKVFLVEYGLFPEFSWQQGLQDCMEAYQQIRTDAAQWQIQADESVIAADASGCSIALSMQQQLAAQQIDIKAMTLFFPTFTSEQTSGSVNSLVYQVEQQALVQQWFESSVLSVEDSRTVPALAQVSVQIFVAVAEADDFKAATQALLDQLKQNNTPFETVTAQGLRGSCLPLMRDCPETAAVYEAAVNFISHQLNN